MNFSCNSLTTSLAQDELLSLTDSKPFEVISQVGCLWVTMDEDTRDIILEPGQRHVFAADERALIVALKPSQFLVNKAAPQAVVQPPQPAAGFDLLGALRRAFGKPHAAPLGA